MNSQKPGRAFGGTSTLEVDNLVLSQPMTMCVGACSSCIPREDQRQHEKQVANVDTGGNVGHDRHQHLGECLE